MKKIVTIGWWNGHSNFLSCIRDLDYEISSIVSMSDDWRTTGELMRLFDENFWIHFPPPWDVRKCLYSISDFEYSKYFEYIFENVFTDPWNISKYTVLELFRISSREYLSKLWTTISWEFSWWAYKKIDSNIDEKLKNRILQFIEDDRWNIKDYLVEKLWKMLDFILPLDVALKWHKFWNILMWNIYYNLDKNYSKMLVVMHKFLQIEKSKIIPVTTDKAYVKAILENWDVIEKQDRISNLWNYNSRIKEIKLLDSCSYAKSNSDIIKSILEADYIIIPPGDLYTSNIANFIIGWVVELIKYSKAKIILIWNTTNKWWETNWYKVMDFVLEIEKHLWKQIDYLVVNKKRVELSKKEKEQLENDISVKWWKYIYLKEISKKVLEKRWTIVIEEDLLDIKSLYKHDWETLKEIVKELII